MAGEQSAKGLMIEGTFGLLITLDTLWVFGPLLHASQRCRIRICPSLLATEDKGRDGFLQVNMDRCTKVEGYPLNVKV